MLIQERLRCENACAVLHRHDCSVYVPVFSGHEPQMWKISWQFLRRWYEDAKRAVDFVRRRISHGGAFGLSMGGIMATKLATRHLVEYAGTFCSPVSLGILSCQDCFKVFMMAEGVCKWDDHLMKLGGKTSKTIALHSIFFKYVAS